MNQKIKFRWLVVTNTRNINVGSIKNPHYTEMESIESPVLQVFVDGDWETVETVYETYDLDQ